MPAAAKPKPRGAGLGKKVGPLPVWAWGVIVLAVVAFFFLRSRGSSPGSAGDVADGGPLASGTGQGGGGGASGGADPTGDGTTSPGSTGDLGPQTVISSGDAPVNQPSGYQPVNDPSLKPGNQPTQQYIQPPTTPGSGGGGTFQAPPGTVWTAPSGTSGGGGNAIKPGLQM